jgi:hypothetical protein
MRFIINSRNGTRDSFVSLDNTTSGVALICCVPLDVVTCCAARPVHLFHVYYRDNTRNILICELLGTLKTVTFYL